MPKRTYSRMDLSDALHALPSKKPRVQSTFPEEFSSDAAISPNPSSDSLPELSSDIIVPTSTPPSSPHLRVNSSQTSPRVKSASPRLPSPPLPKPRKPTFSFIKRSAAALQPLAPISANSKVGRTKSDPTRKKLTQLTIDLGQRTTLTCPKCGMNYAPSQPTDVALHTKHHANEAAVFQLPTPLTKSLERKVVWASKSTSHCIIRISRRDEAVAKRFAEKILEAVEEELGGVGISIDRLWSVVERENSVGHMAPRDRFTVFLYLQGRRCTGLLLAERIFSARRVLPSELKKGSDVSSSKSSSSVVASEDLDPATLGVSRIWTARLERGHGVATQLLDATRSNFLPLLSLPMDRIAFTQPTESGLKLARKWFGKADGWHVYTE